MSNLSRNQITNYMKVSLESRDTLAKNSCKMGWIFCLQRSLQLLTLMIRCDFQTFTFMYFHVELS